MTPPKLASWSHSLPPILYITYRISISSYSKAPWGLSVLMRVTCIFTGIMISPSPWLRQCPDHYTFRAGQNLPDKEFRYLRTPPFTGASIRTFELSSCLYLSSPLNLPALGRCQLLYFFFRICRNLCFW